MQVSATGADGNPVTTGQLGHQGVFNYLPTWDAGTATLRGNGPDTQGSSSWFRPTVPITSLTLRMTVLTGGCDGRAAGTVRLLAGDGTVVAETTAGADTTTTDGVAQPRPDLHEPLATTGVRTGLWFGTGALLVTYYCSSSPRAAATGDQESRRKTAGHPGFPGGPP